MSRTGCDGDLAAQDTDLDQAHPGQVGAVGQPGADREVAAVLDPDQQVRTGVADRASNACEAKLRSASTIIPRCLPRSRSRV